MDLHKASWLTKELMKPHGLLERGWTVRLVKATSFMGRCVHNDKEIHLSLSYTFSRDEAGVRNTILHEIAHALVGAGHGHDSVWYRKARELGCSGERCTEITQGRPEKRYLSICSVHGVVTQHMKMPRIKYSCPQCSPKYDERYILRNIFNPKFLDQHVQIENNRPK